MSTAISGRQAPPLASLRFVSPDRQPKGDGQKILCLQLGEHLLIHLLDLLLCRHTCFDQKGLYEPIGRSHILTETGMRRLISREVGDSNPLLHVLAPGILQEVLEGW